MKSSAVLKPAGAHRRLDEPFWKLEGCERQSSDLGCRIVLRRHGDFPSPDAANHRLFMLRRNTIKPRTASAPSDAPRRQSIRVLPRDLGRLRIGSMSEMVG